MLVLGLDEAGRGPVLGPLVLGAVAIEAARLEALAALGVADSKRLSRARREALLPQIARLARVETLALEPAELEGNLTEVELKGLVRLVRAIGPDAVYLDAPVPPAAIPAFLARLRAALDEPVALVAENRAEARYPVVAAASIVAKVARDRAMRALQACYGDIGWGYPAEPKTRAFLRRCLIEGRWPPCVRTRWATVQRLRRHGASELG